jgi:S1-C subfamily serine protease
MSSTTFPLKFLSRKRWLARISLVVGFVCLTLCGWVVNTTLTYAGERPGGNMSDPVVRTVDIARPAVVRIMTTLGGRLTVRFAPTPQSATFPLNGGSYPLTLSGSGAFVSASGDILTADHVVNPPHDQSLNEFLYEAAANAVANYINQHFSVNPPYTKNEVLFDLESGAFPSTPTYTSATSEVYLSTEYTGPQSVSKLAAVPSTMHAKVDRIEQESSFDKNDVAIVHVSNMNDMPSIQLGDSSGVQEQDNLTIIGFPGSGDVNDDPTDFLTSSVNKVFVSAMKTTNKGALVIQVGGNVEHGDSGGPALDEQGNVVGIVSFGLDIPNTFGQTTFLQASNSAKTLVQGLHLDTTPGRFQKAWFQAFTDYASNTPGHWHRALKELQQIASQYPLFQATTSYLTLAQTLAKSERLPQSQPQTDVSHIILIAGIIVVILMALIFFGVAFAMRRGKKSPPIASKQPTSTTTPPDANVQNDQMRAEYGTLPGASPGYTPPLFTSPYDTYVVTGTQPFTTNRPDEEATASGPSPAWSLPVPVRSSSDQEPQLSACGHLNTSDARYCRTCGKHIAPGHTFGPIQP